MSSPAPASSPVETKEVRPRLVTFRHARAHTETYTQKLEQIMARMPVYSDPLPLPYSEAAVFFNCACPAFIEKQKVDPECPLFQLAWFALNGLLREDMVPVAKIVPDKDAYLQALSFLKTVGAEPAVLRLFESFYVTKIFIRHSKDNIREVFKYYSSVTIETEEDSYPVVYQVYLSANTVEIFYPAYGSNGGTLHIDDFIDKFEERLQDNDKAGTDASVDYHIVTFGPSRAHIYENPEE
jgi:hypothetical protein